LSPGSKTFEQALFDLYRSGRISMDEALANADSPSNLHNLISNAPTATGASKTPPPTHGGRTTSNSTDDLSSIKLDLDALG
ncbi:MAG: type IV pili twitching motility protein PilT, partial [Betaproteobacteria bacterium]|nr:type IV pili twitching motility protein PilT [Betaproteobacteria bacterium]